MRHRGRIASAAFGGCLLIGLSVLASAQVHAQTAYSVPAAKGKPNVKVVILGPDSVREDRLSSIQVVFTGVDAKTRVRVNWGDGERIEVARGTCGTKGAAQHPEACQVTLTPRNYVSGQYFITATAGSTKATKAITVTPGPKPWSPPIGWIQPSGWSLLSTSATYLPCQTVDWYFDRSGETPDRVNMIQDIAAGLAFLVPETGLTFVQTNDPKQADLTFTWGDLTGRGASVAGVGGPDGDGTASVTFSNNHWWTKDEWAGRGTVRVDDTTRPGWYYQSVGRQSLVIHEVMHALGFGHVDDVTSMMYPQGNDNSNAGILNPKDREGLRTMYLNNPCPA